MSHPNGYTKEMVKELLGSSWPTIDPNHETGNQLRKRIGREIREGKRPKPTYPSAESRSKLPNFDKDGKYIDKDYQCNNPFGKCDNCCQFLK